MGVINRKHTALVVALMLFSAGNSYAGPPFVTDDPQPVAYQHWEYYIASVHTFQSDSWSGTLPHFEVNYGLIPDVQIHLLLPINYTYSPHRETQWGYANTEVGIKYCFVHETENIPQIGIFPIIEIPTFRNKSFSDGNAQYFLPLWVQKSWSKLTSYGGIGYSIKPGTNNKNSIFTGGELQYDFSPMITLGGEIYYHSADAVGAQSVTAFNIGGSINASDKTHFIFSMGHSLSHGNFVSAYIGLLWTI